MKRGDRVIYLDTIPKEWEVLSVEPQVGDLLSLVFFPSSTIPNNKCYFNLVLEIKEDVAYMEKKRWYLSVLELNTGIKGPLWIRSDNVKTDTYAWYRIRD